MAEMDMIVKRRRLDINYNNITTVDGNIKWNKSIGYDKCETSKVHELPLAVAVDDKTSGRKNSMAIAMDKCEQ